MTDEHEPQIGQDRMSPEEVAWIKANLPRIHRWMAGRRFLQEALVMAFVLGLVSHVVGYLLQTATSGEPLGLVADLLATLGTTVWTGVVLFCFVELLPAAKRRSAARWLAVYEATVSEQGGPRAS